MKADATVEARYTCDKCGLKNVAVEVPARGPEDVVAWLEKIVAPRLSSDHREKSPFCRITHFTQVWLPIPLGGGRIGEVTKQ